MLRKDVVQAVSEGKFHIYPVSTIDECLAILTGVDAGKVMKGKLSAGHGKLSCE